MPVTAFVSSPLGLVAALVLLGLWNLVFRRTAGGIAAISSFLLAIAGWVGLHEMPPLGWLMLALAFIVPLAASRGQAAASPPS